MQRRSFITSGIILAGNLAFPLTGQAQVASINDAINKSGRQRMLTQRLAKAYLQIGQEVEIELSKKILDQSMSNFDRQLVELLAFTPHGDTHGDLSNMEKTWLEYKQLLVGKAPNQTDAKTVLRLSDNLLQMANGVTQQLEHQASSGAGKLVNLAGRQRMLSQRMAKLYQATHWNIAAANTPAVISQTRNEFVTGMQTLNAASGNNTRLKDELMLAQSQWMFFDAALQVGNDGKSQRQSASNVATTSERILEVMDRITLMYQQLSS